MQTRLAPAYRFGNYAGIPCAARGGDGAGYIVGENSRKHHFAPPFPSANMKRIGGLAEIGGKGRGASDDVEEYVPLSAENHQRTQPDIGRQIVVNDEKHRDGEEEVGRERGEKLGDRLDDLRHAWVQPDHDADRNPNDTRKRNQNRDPNHRKEAVVKDRADITEGQLRGGHLNYLDGNPGGPGDDNCVPDVISHATRNYWVLARRMKAVADVGGTATRS